MPDFSLLDDLIGSSGASPTVKCTTLLSGGVSFPVSLLDESGGTDDSFHVKLSAVPVDTEDKKKNLNYIITLICNQCFFKIISSLVSEFIRFDIKIYI